MQEHHGRRRPAALILIDGADARRLHFPAAATAVGTLTSQLPFFFGWCVSMVTKGGKSAARTILYRSIDPTHSKLSINRHENTTLTDLRIAPSMARQAGSSISASASGGTPTKSCALPSANVEAAAILGPWGRLRLRLWRPGGGPVCARVKEKSVSVCDGFCTQPIDQTRSSDRGRRSRTTYLRAAASIQGACRRAATPPLLATPRPRAAAGAGGPAAPLLGYASC